MATNNPRKPVAFEIRERRPIPNDHRQRFQVALAAEHQRVLAGYAKRFGRALPDLVHEILVAWIRYQEAKDAATGPQQLKLPTTDALNALAVKARDAREALLELAAKRNPPTPKRPKRSTPKQIM